jgi:hypothetical protein
MQSSQPLMIAHKMSFMKIAVWAVEQPVQALNQQLLCDDQLPGQFSGDRLVEIGASS